MGIGITGPVTRALLLAQRARFVCVTSADPGLEATTPPTPSTSRCSTSCGTLRWAQRSAAEEKARDWSCQFGHGREQQASLFLQQYGRPILRRMQADLLFGELYARIEYPHLRCVLGRRKSQPAIQPGTQYRHSTAYSASGTSEQQQTQNLGDRLRSGTGGGKSGGFRMQ